MNCIKKFSRIVCVSLFSYQGCSAVISFRQPVYFIISFRSCQELFSKVFQIFKSCIKLFVSVVLFKRLDYFTISSVDCQQLIWIFWKFIYFSVFQKQFLATACLLYHRRKEKSSTFYKKVCVFCTSYRQTHFSKRTFLFPDQLSIFNLHCIHPVTTQSEWISGSFYQKQIFIRMCSLHAAIYHTPGRTNSYLAPSMLWQRIASSTSSNSASRYPAFISKNSCNISHRRSIIIAVPSFG